MKKIIIVLAAVVTAVVLSGCVNRQLVESYDQYLGTVGAEYLQYVEADRALTGADKTIRQNNHEQAVETVRKFRETKWSW